MIIIEEVEIVGRTPNPILKYHFTDRSYNVKINGLLVASIRLDHSRAASEGCIYLYEIKVFEKRKGYGKQIVQFLMEHYNVPLLKGASSSTIEAYSFWQSLGAEFYYIKEEGYLDIHELIDSELESPFILKNK